jgi:hypothetical protein
MEITCDEMAPTRVTLIAPAWSLLFERIGERQLRQATKYSFVSVVKWKVSWQEFGDSEVSLPAMKAPTTIDIAAAKPGATTSLSGTW